MILGFSDQQLITGISIMVIGYIKVCSISTYHFYIIQTLAMFSCSAHLASVTSLRRYFQEHPVVARLRISFMLVFALLLATALLMLGIGITERNENPMSLGSQCPMLCFMRDNQSVVTNRLIGVIMVLLLLISYWSALAYVFPDANVVFTTWLLTRPLITIEALLQAIPGGRFGHQFHERFMHSKLWFPSLFVAFGGQSIWWTVSFAFSVVIRATKRPAESGSAAVWSFGQILALLMMALPFFSAVEVFYGQINKLYNSSVVV
jgi:hypothetical protein